MGVKSENNGKGNKEDKAGRQYYEVIERLQSLVLVFIA